MRRTRSLLALLTAVFLVLALEQAFTQEERIPIKVKSSVVVTGVVLVDIVKDGKPFRLQCNEEVSSCKVLKSGDYWMAELPPNWGVYDCKNVDVYRSANGDSSNSEALGEYCLIPR